MKRGLIKDYNNYIKEIYDAKIEIAIIKWERGTYPKNDLSYKKKDNTF